MDAPGASPVPDLSHTGRVCSPRAKPPALQVEAIHEGLAEPIPGDRGRRGRPRSPARPVSGVVRSTTAMIERSVVHQRTGLPRNPIFAKLLRGGAAAWPR